MSRPDTPPPTWRRYEECRPDELRTIVEKSPVAFWAAGLVEHHGWHLPVGLDTLKAEGILKRVAQRTGGILLPALWWGWGGEGGHRDSLWTHYLSSDDDVIVDIVGKTVPQLVSFGFKAVVVLAGHGPYVQPLERLQIELGSRMPDTLLLFGIETTIVGPIEGLGVDHAAFWETSDALELFPQLVDLSALTPGRDPTADWPRDVVAPASVSQYPDLVLDPRQSRFGQLERRSNLGVRRERTNGDQQTRRRDRGTCRLAPGDRCVARRRRREHAHPVTPAEDWPNPTPRPVHGTSVRREDSLTPVPVDHFLDDLDAEARSRWWVDPSINVIERHSHEIMLHRVAQRFQFEELACR